MVLAPLPDALNVGRASEVIAIGWFVQPAALTVGLAGPAAIRGRTEKVASRIMPVGREEFFAAVALASGKRGTHRPPSRKKTQPATESKTASGRRQNAKKEEKSSRGIPKKITRKKTEFQTAGFSPLSFRR